MLLARYLLKRFFTHVFFIAISLTLLFNLIEFFEKMVRVKNSSTSTILYFIGLQMLPSLFENLPVATWLASCMTLKEMYQQNEWEILQLLNIPIKKIVTLILFAGISLAIFSFIGKELITHHIAQSAELFKQKEFKQHHNKKMFNQWFTFDEKTYCHIQFLDLQKNKGQNLSLFNLSESFGIKTITTSNLFSINLKTKEIILVNAKTIHVQEKKETSPEGKKLYFPNFFTQLQLKNISPPLSKAFQLVIFDYKIIPTPLYHQLLYSLLNRILFHFLLIIYPLLTFMLFFLFPYHKFYRWILIFLPYPFITVLFTINDSLMQTFSSGWLATTPYILITMLIVILYNTIRK